MQIGSQKNTPRKYESFKGKSCMHRTMVAEPCGHLSDHHEPYNLTHSLLRRAACCAHHNLVSFATRSRGGCFHNEGEETTSLFQDRHCGATKVLEIIQTIIYSDVKDVVRPIVVNPEHDEGSSTSGDRILVIDVQDSDYKETGLYHIM